MAKNYEVLPGYKRFNQKDNTIMRTRWDSSFNSDGSFSQKTHKAINEHFRKGEKGYGRLDFALNAGSQTVKSSLGTDVNHANSGLTSWEPLPSSMDRMVGRRLPDDAGKFPVADQARMRGRVEKAARFYGADLVGFTELDERWLYSHHYIPETGENPPVELPEGCREVVVLGVAMDYEMIRTAPTPIMMSATQESYSRMAKMVASLAQFIRALGYTAIPSMNDTALSIPLAVDAGLGQPSRMGPVITPEFGPRVRFCKVFTDLPLGGKKKGIDIGVIEFCEVCQKCVQACPVRAIPEGPRTTEGHNISNNPKTLKWYVHYEKCRRYLTHVGTNCGICLRSCPFNKGKGFHHSIARWMVRKRLPFLDRLLVRLDDWLGYSEQKDPGSFWDGKGA